MKKVFVCFVFSVFLMSSAAAASDDVETLKNELSKMSQTMELLQKKGCRIAYFAGELDTGAEIIITQCPGCIMQLESGLKELKTKGVEVLDLAQVLAISMGLS